MTTDHRLSTEDLTLAYDGTTVVHDLSLSLPPGRITTIVGANACGKSTLLRGLARLMAPTASRKMLAPMPMGPSYPRTPERLVEGAVSGRCACA